MISKIYYILKLLGLFFTGIKKERDSLELKNAEKILEGSRTEIKDKEAAVSSARRANEIFKP